jgi:RimJ/RimL family protein N-acetyltransferase
VTACPTLQTERLVLRPFHDDDVDAYFVVLDTPEVRRSLHLPEALSRDDAWQQMAVWRGQWELRGSGQWALIRRDDGAFLGRAGLHRPERVGWPGLEVGWTLHPDHWGQGYATEAGRASIDWAFANHGVDQLVSCILAENTASQNVARRLGFTHDRDEVLPHFPSMPHGVWTLGRGDRSAP